MGDQNPGSKRPWNNRHPWAVLSFPFPSFAVSPTMKRTVCVLVPLVCGFSLTRIDFSRDSHPSRIVPHWKFAPVLWEQSKDLYSSVHSPAVAAIFLSRCILPTHCPHEPDEPGGHLSSSSPWHLTSRCSLPPLFASGEQEQNVLLALYVKKSDWAGLFPIPQFSRQARLTIPKKPPTLKAHPAPSPCCPAAELHNAQCVTASQPASQQQWSAKGTPLFGHAIGNLEDRPCDVTATARMLCCNPPSFRSPMTYVTQATCPVPRQELGLLLLLQGSCEDFEASAAGLHYSRLGKLAPGWQAVHRVRSLGATAASGGVGPQSLPGPLSCDILYCQGAFLLVDPSLL